MNAFKSGQPLSPGTSKRRTKKAKEEESSEDESDTEGEEGDDTSETDTVAPPSVLEVDDAGGSQGLS